MSKNPVGSIEQALVKLDDKRLFDVFCEQLVKDLSLCGLPSDEIDCRDIESVSRSLSAFVSHYLEKDAEALRALLYRIDLSEAALVDLVAMSENRNNDIANAIILRELQKVLYRLKGRLD